jgi:hypothetical protein
MVLAKLQCPSGATLRFAVCHSSCSSSSFLTAATCVLHATSFISSFVPLNYTTFAAKQFASRHGTLSTAQNKAQVMHIPFAKPLLQYSPGSTPLYYVLHSLQAHSVHPLPIYLFSFLKNTKCI